MSAKTFRARIRKSLANQNLQIALDGNEIHKKWVLTGANGHFMAGNFDGKQFKPETKSFPSEWGKNYYAVQSYSDLKDGRRIQIGWMAGAGRV